MIRGASLWISTGLFAILAFSAVSLFADRDKVTFGDLEAQTKQFIAWEKTIRLTPEQELVKKAALTEIPAPCCDDNSAYTCCCSCNISRTIWGLANYMITEHDADVRTLQAKVSAWINFITPNGYSGKACYIRGCSRAFKNDGCGGMRRSQVVF